ncbi:MAG: choice-of-anchor V domain-containing protein, partial [Gammaproteobacteria bacterium]
RRQPGRPHHHRPRREVKWLAFALAALLPAPALLALHFRDGPPARVTGGFGEDSCLACHSGNALNDPAGMLTLGGFPERYVPGQRYELELALSRSGGIATAGFQLAVRLATGNTQAGTLNVPEPDTSGVALLEERGVQFAYHRRADASRADAGSFRWKISWTAPESAGDVILHAAAVAGDGDESQLEDYVYSLKTGAARECGATPITGT